jgi:2-hydroxy-3-keto-5-methylthiopentenyl-1-phosphate phosphatase
MNNRRMGDNRMQNPLISSLALPRIGRPGSIQVWIDFDGTITRRDVLDDLIALCAENDSWKQVEARWQAGEIGSRECLEAEFSLLRIDDDRLDAFLDRVVIDPGVVPLLNLLEEFDIPRAIVSDGIERFIHRILTRHGVKSVPVRANVMQRDGLRMQLQCPHSSSACESASAHCKCCSIHSIGDERRQSIYIGDGRSDLCPARKADVVFAKGALAAALRKEERPFRPFETLLDVAATLHTAWSGVRMVGS